MKSLEKELYDVANSIVGNVAPEIHIKKGWEKVSVTGEAYITYGAKFKNFDEIMPSWIKWIESYILFKQSILENCCSIKNNPPLGIFWRKRPEIKKHKGLFYVYARVLFSRFYTDTRPSDNNYRRWIAFQ